MQHLQQKIAFSVSFYKIFKKNLQKTDRVEMESMAFIVFFKTRLITISTKDEERQKFNHYSDATQ